MTSVKFRLGLRWAIWLVPGCLQAAGFSLLEQTGSGIGYAYAGAAASADDASALYFNPAALVMLDAPQLTIALHGINIGTKFVDRGSALPPAGLGMLPEGATRSDAGSLVAVPNAYVAWPVGKRLAFGFGLNAPFGLVTEYDDPWVGRFQGIRSKLTAINANPALAYRLNDSVAVGFGVNYQHARVELSNAVLLGAGLEGRAALDVEDEAWGWNAGAIFTLPAATRIGLSYRSKLDYALTGDTQVTTLAGTPIAPASGSTLVDVTFPDSIELSAAQPIGSLLELRADINWMNWSEIDTVLAINPATGLTRDVLQFGFKDTTRVALGLDYKKGERWSLRTGIAWDESPVDEDVRTVRLPDDDRWWVTVGARWRPSERLIVDAGYAHLIVGDVPIDRTRGQTGAPASFASHVLGVYDSTVDIASVQLSWTLR